MTRDSRTTQTSAPRPIQRLIVWLVVGVLMTSTSGCVYFNTFYHARKNFSKAEKEHSGRPGNQRGVSAASRLYEDAITKAQKVIEKHPNSKYHDDALLMVGISYFRMGDFAKAERRFRDLLAIHPDSDLNEEGRLYLARCRVELGDEQAGFRTFTELAKTATRDEYKAEAIYQRGVYFAEIGLPDSAVTSFSRVVEEFPKSDRAVDARLDGAGQLRELDRPLEAVAFYEPLIKDDDTLIVYDALLGTATALYEAGRHDSGVVILRSMIEDDRFSDSIGTIRLTLADGLTVLGDDAGAWREYLQITAELEMTPSASEAYFRMAEITQFDFGDLVGARDLYDASRREDQRGEWANQALARSAYISRLTEFRRTLGRGELQRQSSPFGDQPHDPENIPPLERFATYSTIDERPPAWDSLQVAGRLPDGNYGEGDLLGPPAPNPDVMAEAGGDGTTTGEQAATAETNDEFGPPLELAPVFGPEPHWADLEYNRKRRQILSLDLWWALEGTDSLYGPPSPAMAYPYGMGKRLGPPTPSDSALAAWEEAERNRPERLAREQRADRRQERRAAFADIANEATTQLQLAELYRFDLAYPDSAVAEYRKIADGHAGTPFGAQALIAAADIYARELKDTAQANTLLRRVLREYPYSDYAGDAIIRLGWRGTDADTAHPAWAYAKAERAIAVDDDPARAILILQDFIERYPYSRLIPTAEYAIVALTDKHFGASDSTLIWAYEEITAEYPATQYAIAAKERLNTTITRPKRRLPPKAKDSAEQLAAADSTKTDSTQMIGASLPLAPKPRNVGLFAYPQSEIGNRIPEHVVVYKIVIDHNGDISEYEVLQRSPSYDIQVAVEAALKDTKFWADSIAPDSLYIPYRYELTITPPADALDEWDRYNIDKYDPKKSQKDENP